MTTRKICHPLDTWVSGRRLELNVGTTMPFYRRVPKTQVEYEPNSLHIITPNAMFAPRGELTEKITALLKLAGCEGRDLLGNSGFARVYDIALLKSYTLEQVAKAI